MQTLTDVQEAVKACKIVCWKTKAYRVIVDNLGQWFVWCVSNDNYVGLTLDYKPTDFFIVD